MKGQSRVGKQHADNANEALVINNTAKNPQNWQKLSKALTKLHKVLVLPKKKVNTLTKFIRCRYECFWFSRIQLDSRVTAQGQHWHVELE